MHTIKAEHTLTHLYGKDFLSLKDVSPSDINALLTEASLLKQHPIQPIFQGKTLAMIFEKSSTRTRVSFEAGMAQLGGNGTISFKRRPAAWAGGDGRGYGEGAVRLR